MLTSSAQSKSVVYTAANHARTEHSSTALLHLFLYIDCLSVTRSCRPLSVSFVVVILPVQSRLQSTIAKHRATTALFNCSTAAGVLSSLPLICETVRLHPLSHTSHHLQTDIIFRLILSRDFVLCSFFRVPFIYNFCETSLLPLNCLFNLL